MKPIYLLDLTKCSGAEIAALRRDGFNVPPNIAGYRSYHTIMWDTGYLTDVPDSVEIVGLR